MSTQLLELPQTLQTLLFRDYKPNLFRFSTGHRSGTGGLSPTEPLFNSGRLVNDLQTPARVSGSINFSGIEFIEWTEKE